MAYTMYIEYNQSFIYDLKYLPEEKSGAGSWFVANSSSTTTGTEKAANIAITTTTTATTSTTTAAATTTPTTPTTTTTTATTTGHTKAIARAAWRSFLVEARGEFGVVASDEAGVGTRARRLAILGRAILGRGDDVMRVEEKEGQVPRRGTAANLRGTQYRGDHSGQEGRALTWNLG